MKKPYRLGLVFLMFVCVAAAMVLVARGTPKDRGIRHLTRGNILFQQSEYEKARVEYQNAARLLPTDPEIDYRLGLVYEAEGDVNNAFAGYNIAEHQNAHFKPALLKLANYYIAGGEYDQAQKRIDTVLKDFPDDAEAHALNASILLHEKDFDAALAEVNVAFTRDAGNITAVSVLTGYYVAKGDMAMAAKSVDDGIAHNPKELSLLMLKAQLYENSGNLTKLKETYQSIFLLRPEDNYYRINLGDILLKAGKTDDAESVLRSAIAARPNDSDLKHRLVSFLGEHRGVDAAEKEIRGYMQASPENDIFYFWLADLYLSHDAVDRAVSLLQQIVARNKTDAQDLNARVSLARIHFVKGNKALAEKMIAFVLQREPANPNALFIRADIAFDEGRYQDAVSDLRAIIHAQPKDKEALQLLSEVFLRQGHVDLAIDTLNQLLELDPLNFAAEVRLAQLYDLNGDSARALDLLASVTKSAPQYAIGWESMARILIGAREMPKAESAIHTLSALKGQQMTSVFLEGQVDANKGEDDKAVAAYVKVIDADPSSALAEYSLTALIKVQQRHNKMDEVVRYIESLKTNSPYIATMLGKCYVTLKKPDLAKTAFDKAIAGNSADQTPYLDRAALYLDDHKTQEALQLLKKAATAIPGDARAAMMQAHIFTQSGQYRQAITLYEDMLARNPGFDVAANNLASLLADYEYADPDALVKANKLAQRFANSDNPVLLDTLGWIYYRQGNFSKALSLTMQGMELKGLITPQVHYHYGAIFLKAGKTQEAKAELQQAVIGNANYLGSDDANRIFNGL